MFVVEPGKKYVSCCNCAIDGTMKESHGKLVPSFTELELRFPRTTEEEMLQHHNDVDTQMADFASMKDELEAKKQIYKDFNVNIIRPEK